MMLHINKLTSIITLSSYIAIGIYCATILVAMALGFYFRGDLYFFIAEILCFPSSSLYVCMRSVVDVLFDMPVGDSVFECIFYVLFSCIFNVLLALGFRNLIIYIIKRKIRNNKIKNEPTGQP